MKDEQMKLFWIPLNAVDHMVKTDLLDNEELGIFDRFRSHLIRHDFIPKNKKCLQILARTNDLEKNQRSVKNARGL